MLIFCCVCFVCDTNMYLSYKKYAYTYNWAMHVGPMYAHAYSSCPETLIWTFLLLFIYFTYIICICLVLFYAYESLPLCLFVLFVLCTLVYGFNLLFFHEHAYIVSMHWRIGAVMWWGKACFHINMHLFMDVILLWLDEYYVGFDEHDMQVYTCRYYILYPLRLGPLFINNVGILKPKVCLGPNWNWLEKNVLEKI